MSDVNCDPERDEPVEITEAMIEIGEKLLNIHADGCLGPHHSAHVAETVYRAMRIAEPQVGRQNPLRAEPTPKRPCRNA
jgi:hypothetical protein